MHYSTWVSACSVSGPSLGTGAAEKRRVSDFKDFTASWDREVNKKGENRDNES